MKAKKILCVVAYDVEGDKQRNRISKLLEKYGIRVNFSVFECMFTEKQLEEVRGKTANLICDRSDTVIFYPVCVNCYVKTIYQPFKRQVARSVQIL